MRIILPVALLIALSSFLLFGQSMADEPQQAKKDARSQEEQSQKEHKEKLSYSLGYGVGNQMKNSSVDLDPDIFIKAIKQGLAGDKAAMTDAEMREVIQSFQKEITIKQQDVKKQLAEKNKKQGEAFLAENAKREGVVTLSSGLQYKIVKEGTGKSPKTMDKVSVNYRGTLVSGREFDSSYKRGQPAMFRVGDGIPGWNEALQLMKEGARWQLFIPAHLAYGEKGSSTGIVPPYTTVVYEVELLTVK